jgi:hypothetical protein
MADGGFPHAAGAHQSGGTAGRDIKCEVFKNDCISVICESDIFKGDVSVKMTGRNGPRA